MGSGAGELHHAEAELRRAAAACLAMHADTLQAPAWFAPRVTISGNGGRTLRIAPAQGPARDIPALRPGFTAVLHDEGVWHYFHFTETLIWLWVIQHHLLAGAAPGRIVFTWQWDNPAQNHVQRAILAALYPGIGIVDAQSALPVTLPDALVIDRALARTRLNKFIEGAMGLGLPHVQAMGARVRAALHAFEGRNAAPRILYVTRRPPRCLAPALEQELLTLLAARGALSVVDFGIVPWEQQVRLVAGTDILVGVHGNGLTNALWLRPGGLVLEFFPPGVRHYDYQFFAELTGCGYYGFEGDHIFPAHCRTGPPYGHTPHADAPVTALPLADLARLLDTHIAAHFPAAAGR